MPSGYKSDIEYKDGERITLTELARKHGMSYSTVLQRHHRDPSLGWRELIAKKNALRIELFGEALTLQEAADRLSVSKHAVYSRWKRYRAGSITKETMETVGHIYRTAPVCGKKDSGNEEWWALSGKEKKASSFEGGSWERKNIPEPKNKTTGRRGRVNRATDTDVHYNPMAVRI